MKNLSQWLQTNPIIVLAMFATTSISSIIGISIGWRQLYDDFLSRTIEIPAWLIMVIIILIILMIIKFKSVPRSNDAISDEVIEGKKFGVQQLLLDGKRYERCIFDRSELIYEGRRFFILRQSTLKDVRLTFSGYAANTIMMLTGLYHDPAMRFLVDEVISNIKSNRHEQSIPPNNS